MRDNDTSDWQSGDDVGERLLGDAELRVQQLVARAGGALETRDVRPEDATEDPVAG